jgi:hypothetical protein
MFVRRLVSITFLPDRRLVGCHGNDSLQQQQLSHPSLFAPLLLLSIILLPVFIPSLPLDVAATKKQHSDQRPLIGPKSETHRFFIHFQHAGPLRYFTGIVAMSSRTGVGFAVCEDDS